jgi:hypothetical protein
LGGDYLQAQEKRYFFALSAGPTIATGLKNIKQPGYYGELSAVKLFNYDETKGWWLSLVYNHVPPASPDTKTVEGSPGLTVTSTYQSAKYISATIGGKKFYENGVVLALGGGTGFFSETHARKRYSDPIYDYNGPSGGNADWGIANAIEVGYKPGALQVMLRFNSTWTPRTVVVNNPYEKDFPTLVALFGITAGYTF